MKKHLSLFAALLITFTSCKQLVQVPEVQVKSNKAYVTFALSGNLARTILPSNLTKEDLCYELSGYKDNEEEITIGSWETYQKMNEAFASHVELEYGKWTFTLNGLKNGRIAYTSTIQKTLEIGENSVLFALQEAEKGNGDISVSLLFPSTGVAKVSAALFDLSNKVVSGFEEETLVISAEDEQASVLYAKTNIPCGNYVVKFFIYQNEDDETPINVKSEVIYVAPGNLSSGSINIKDFNSYSTITYDLDIGEWKEGFTPVTKYNINQSVTLPTPEDIPDDFYLYGWYEQGDESKTYVTKIDIGTFENKTYVADIAIKCYASDLQTKFNKYSSRAIKVYILDDTPNLSTIVTVIKNANSLLIDLDISGCTGLTSIGSSAFYGCSGLTSVTIPDSVTSIGSSAFYGCSGLTSVTIPDSVTSIGSSAFSGCSGLKEVHISNIESWVKISFYTAYSNPLNFAKHLYLDETEITELTIPEGTTSIRSYAFYGCSGLTSITIPDSVTSIGSSAFYGCSGLTSVTIPESVTSIDDFVFKGCSGLTSVTIPDSVTSIGYSAFSGCSGLTSVTIPDSVTSIGYSAFSGCSGLTSVIIPDSVTSIGGCVFYGCSGLTSVTIPESVTSIDDFVFKGCSGLTSVTIPDSVTSIGYSVFSGCSGLTSVIIPDSVTSIGYDAFYNVPHIYYTGSASGSPWGAKAKN